MAKVVKEFTIARSRMGNYQWPKWFDGRIWHLTHGTDFNAKPEYMAQLAYRTAIRMGVKVRVSTLENAIELQSY